MLVNDVDINNFSATLLKKDIQNATLLTIKDWLKKANNPLNLSQKFYYKTISCEFLIETNTEEETLIKISNFINILKNCTLKFNELSFFYDCILDENTTTKTTRSNKKVLTCDFSGYAYKNPIIEILNHVTSKTINIPGNQPTPAIVTITAPIDTISLTLTGFGEDPISVKNLKANIPVILDGDICTVLQAGLNKFGETDLWEYPTLQPGANTIGVSTANSIINISYKPKYI